MNNGLNLSEISNAFAKSMVEANDNAALGYITGAVSLLQAQGKDITQYAIINVENPMVYKDGAMRVTLQWRIVPITDLREEKK